MRIIARAAVVALVALAAGSVLGACTSSSPSSVPSTSLASKSTTATAIAAPTTAAATTATCQPSQLHIVRLGSSGAAGTGEVTFSLTNRSTVGCTMHGYPGMVLLDASAGALPTNVMRGGGLAFENLAVTRVSLAAGQTAYFNVGFSDVTVGTTTCSEASQVEITPPNATSYAVVAMLPSIDACNGGTLHVSPVFASTDSTATQTTAPS